MRVASLVAAAVVLVACGKGDGSVEAPLGRGLPVPVDVAPSPAPTAPPTAPPAAVGAEADYRVAPGLVSWHANFDSARAAAARSGKLVLLFAMLGHLDRERC